MSRSRAEEFDRRSVARSVMTLALGQKQRSETRTRTCSASRTSRHRRGTPAAPVRRYAGPAGSAPNRGVRRGRRQPGDRPGHPDGGASCGLLRRKGASRRLLGSDRATAAPRYGPRSGAPPATALLPPAPSKASTRPDSATPSATTPRPKRRACRRGMIWSRATSPDRAWKPHVHRACPTSCVSDVA